MNGHVRKRGRKWEVVLELGRQPAQRCPACMVRRGRNGGRLLWTERGRSTACPICGGPLEDVTSRRQITLPERFRTKREAQERLTRELHSDLSGDFVQPDKLTVGEYLTAHWLPTLTGTVRPTTQLAYKLHVHKHIVPYIGAIRLRNLTTKDVDRLYATLASQPGARGKPLSPATCRAVHRALHRALAKAVEWNLIARNPSNAAERPRIVRHEMTVWSRQELAMFLQLTDEDRLGTLWRLMALTGLRRGEVLALRWSDIDLSRGRLTVRRARVQVGYLARESDTKTGRGRTVSLDTKTIEALRRQNDQQMSDCEEWGEAWVGEGHVFTRENGAPWQPDRITKVFDHAVKSAGVTRIRLHDLRHTHATHMLEAGVHPKVVQERLGHANIAMTLDTYSHVIPALQESAAEMVAALIDVEP